MTSVTNRNFEECFQVNVIGDNVKRLRKKHLLNQVEFAKLIGVSQGSLSDIEQGKCKPSVETIISIQEKFGCSFEWLLKGNVISNSDNLLIASLSPFEIELINDFRKLDLTNQLETCGIIKLKLRT
jgi:transcriptional regulator with XRE-family HTH domain